MPRKRPEVELQVVSAGELGWLPGHQFFLLDKEEAHGPFESREAALAAALRQPNMYGYGPAPQIGHIT